jgi:hypothetical protein
LEIKRHIVESVPQFINDDIIGCGCIRKSVLYSKVEGKFWSRMGTAAFQIYLWMLNGALFTVRMAIC